MLVTLDTTRADHLGTYGYFRETTPFLDRFAQDALVFEDAIVPMATTLPTHTSLLTGTYPLEHGVLANLAHTGHYFAPSEELRSFAEFCRDAGYRTAAFVSAVPLKKGTGIEAGFEHFSEPPGDDRERPAAETVRLALEWLAEEPEDRPLFLWLHVYDPHWPYVAPEEFRRFDDDEGLDRWIEERGIPARVFRKKAAEQEDARESHNLYDAELAYVDHHLERLFEGLQARARWPGTATVIAGDHGEALCQHGRTGHGWTWNEQVHAPLILRVPGVEPRRVAGPVSIVDALPTLLGLLDVPALEPFLIQARGRDVLAAGFEPTPVLSQDTGVRIDHPGAKVYHQALTGERWKLIRVETKGLTPEGELPPVTHRLYDLSVDPYELNDLAAQRPDVVEELDRELSSILDEQRRTGERLGGGQRRAADDDVIRKLTDLGYMEGADEDEPSADEPEEPGDPEDPGRQ